VENNAPDHSVLTHIQQLTEKEETLYGKPDLTDEDVRGLHDVKNKLDQYWNFLGQRRFFRHAGKDPGKSKDAIVKRLNVNVYKAILMPPVKLKQAKK
jgi:hypothetical protein